jgi:DNA-binding beta-propeller fold protein YncE
MKQKFIAGVFAFSAVIAILFTQCTKHKKETIVEQVNTSCYPDDVGKIFVLKCATSGCHNTASKDACAGLDLSSWDKLFNGAKGGAAVIPYSADQSFLVNFINTYSDLGPSQLPTMPNNGTPLSKAEVQTVINWINDGAPDCNGKRFTDNPDRKKFYITNEGCDLVSVFDAERKVIMRYVTVGANPNLIEVPHCIKISPDGKFWYVSFTDPSGIYFQKFKTSDDTFVGQVEIGSGSWNTFSFTPDSKWAYIADLNGNNIARVNCETMTLFAAPFDPGTASPHGTAISPDGNYLYLTHQLGDELLKLDITTFPPDGPQIHFNDTIQGGAHPHEIAFSPDGKLYFVTCQATHEVKVFNAQTDVFLKSIFVGPDPVEMAFSLSTNNMFVTCMNGNAVSIINYVDTVLVKTISTPGVFYGPHGVAVDDTHGVCYISNRNLVTSGGPLPHHTSFCGGRNGYLLAIDLNTLELIPDFKQELSVDPYSFAIRK